MVYFNAIETDQQMQVVVVKSAGIPSKDRGVAQFSGD
jgi:hypothetical protein